MQEETVNPTLDLMKHNQYLRWWAKGNAIIKQSEFSLQELYERFGSELEVFLNADPLVYQKEKLTLNSVDTVHFLNPLEPCVLFGIKSKAVNQFLELGESASDESILRFANAYGPLLSMAGWINEYILSDKWSIRMNIGDLFSPIEGDLHFYEDDSFFNWKVYLLNEFLNWCTNSHNTKVSAMNEYILCMKFLIKSGEVQHFDEPAALYRWASFRAASFKKDLEAGQLSPESDSWLYWNFQQLRLIPGTGGRSLQISGASLLSQLTLEIWRMVYEVWPKVRDCLFCGKEFTFKNGHQKYCCEKCAVRGAKRKQREAMKKKKLQEEGKSDGQTW